MHGPARAILADTQTGKCTKIGIGSWGLANLHHSLRTWTLPQKMGTKSRMSASIGMQQTRHTGKTCTPGSYAT